MKISFALILSVLMTTHAFAADCFSVASGYTPGMFNVSIMGEKGGLAEAMIPLLVAAGATTHTQLNCAACPYTTVTLPESSQSIMVRTPSPGIPAYHWSFNLAFTDGLQVNATAPGLQFNGSMAETLYRGLEAMKSGSVGWTSNAEDTIDWPIYQAKGTGYSLTCMKQAEGVRCSIYLEPVCKI